MSLRDGRTHNNLWLQPAERRAARILAVRADLASEEVLRQVFLLGLVCFADTDVEFKLAPELQELLRPECIPAPVDEGEDEA